MANKKLGPYLIDRRLGHGGMGTVYAGVHEQTGQWAAIKVLSENLSADPRFRERFMGEVETLKLLHHPNIVTLVGYGEEDGQLFFVMELVDGLSLEAELQAGRRFQWDEVVEIAVQVCAALKHAHDHGVIHRDLKPANLLLTPDGTVKLTDFGIAKLFGVAGLTMAGSMIGTPDYMSPEQTEGHPATARSDLYSLGCVMYALIAGKPPFTSPSITKIIDRVRSSEALPLRRLVPDLPEPMERIVAQLLNKNPAQRIATPQSLANLLRAMKHALTSQGAESEPETVEQSLDDSPLGARGNSPSEPSLPATGEGATLDFSTDEARRFKGEKTDFHVVGSAAEDPGETTAFDPEPPSPATLLPARQTRFTFVPASGTRRGPGAADQGAPARHERWMTAGIATALLLIAGSFIWAFLPASADRLYQRIEQATASEEPPLRFDQWLDEFLRRFPDDARTGQVQRWQQQHACRALQRDLQRKLRGLTEPERLYLEGLRLSEEGRTADACASFRQIVQQLEASQPADLGATGRRLLERARYLCEEFSCPEPTAEPPLEPEAEPRPEAEQ
jgi:serine/threonine-protein kinase